ncbi:MAG TPA: DUF1957 domain-containing protein [Firmicutes bacterium]|jgi:1,4-alpha-glucan branching enzyme|nr:DUF1957 domain-containing protein [Bacillota bacterium]HOQ23907.1 DUF1957 domain-containing protein [Bacillota bacterium]HPT67159.1 DUF1957 domain-containing protein [Bacillota bacterium]
MRESKPEVVGYLAVVLHAHLPFIPHTAAEPTLEEKWLFEALTESYIPFLLSWERLAEENVRFQLTLSISPPLLTMLTDSVELERYSKYLRNLQELSEREAERTRNDPHYAAVAEFYRRRLREIGHAFHEKYRTDLLAPLKKLKELGHLEIITTGATHGFLPLMATEEAKYAQLHLALDYFEAKFGWRPSGIWLPECGYCPGLERLLDKLGIGYFIISSHGMLSANPRPETAVYAPVRLAGTQVNAFGRDWETSHQVWSRTEGYPGDYWYREFYRDIGWDLDYDYLQPYLLGGVRGDTGLKYHRITGKSDYKEVYQRDKALERVKEHARDFLANRQRQLSYWRGTMKQPPIVVAPYDTELFGHWWFEGPDWLEEVLRLVAQRDTGIATTTLQSYLWKYPASHEATFGPSSWGEGGYNRVWLNEENDWIYPRLHRAEKLIKALTEGYPQPGPEVKRGLNQAVRELLLAQSSDWPFILTNRTVVDYARARLEWHLGQCERLLVELLTNGVDPANLRYLEETDRVFPGLDYRVFCSLPASDGELMVPAGLAGTVVIMLSWEYPPWHVGGLGVHVRDLAETMARLGQAVHVVTVSPHNQGKTIVQNGVHVHFLAVDVPQEARDDFLAWVLRFNLVMADFAGEMVLRSPKARFLLHAHDWMVGYAARELKARFDLLGVATIHATEHGRNRGLHNPLQHAIHRLEEELVHGADRVICCSRYMQKEIETLFGLAADGVYMIPNAVNLSPAVEIVRKEQVILFIGRLVAEKGVQVLIEAFARLSGLYPDASLVIAGSGPYTEELQNMVRRLGLTDRIRFMGFVAEKVRDELLKSCSIAVFPSLYEPFGIVALEAMASGTPVVVSRTGGLAEIVEDGVSGLCFTPGDAGELQRCLVKLLQSPATARELSKNARLRVEQEFNWEAVAKRTLEVYHREQPVVGAKDNEGADDRQREPVLVPAEV